jgi:hypothetical protein
MMRTSATIWHKPDLLCAVAALMPTPLRNNSEMATTTISTAIARKQLFAIQDSSCKDLCSGAAVTTQDNSTQRVRVLEGKEAFIRSGESIAVAK